MELENQKKSYKIYIASNGCDRRLLDSQKITDFFKADNHFITKVPKEADYIFVNTCAMSQTAEDTSVNLIKKHLGYKAKLVVHGCLPQIAPMRYEKEFSEGKIIKIDSKDLNNKMDDIFPYSQVKFSSLPDPAVLAKDQGIFSKIVNKIKFNEIFFLTCISAIKFKLKNLNQPLHPRLKKGSYLQIGSGCTDSCTYCAIPRAIGGMKSKTIDNILRDYARILEKGEDSFILTADNLGLYGLDLGTNLTVLLDEMSKIDTYYRKVTWTFNELHPKWVLRYFQHIADYVKSGKIKELCIPIQSGSNRILDLMKRNYKSEETLVALQKIRNASLGLRLTTDVIIGFPTETDEEFLETIRLIAKVRFDQVMFFSYGKREGTQALQLDFNELENENNIKRRFKMAMKLLDREKINYTFQ
jgi:MiaB/RimO family radical SAM methylthiotransferase